MVNERILARANHALAQTLQAGVLLTGLALASSLAQAQGNPASAAPSDAQLQTAVTAALASDSQLRGQQVTATVSQGVVTLSGSVADDTQRTAAEQTAAQVSGVRSMDDSIGVAGRDVAATEPGDQANAPQQPSAPSSETQGKNAPAPANMPPPPPDDTAQQQNSNQYPSPGEYPQQQAGPLGQRQQAGPYPQQPSPYGQQQGFYPQQPGQGPYGPQQGQYAPPPLYVPGVSPERQNQSGPVTLNPGLLLNVRTSEPLSTARLKDGDFVQFTAASDMYANSIVAIPRGAVLTGQVVEARNAGALGGSPRLDLRLTTLTLGNQTYPLESDLWSSQGPSKTGYTAANTVGGAAFGAIIGAIAGGGVGAGVGAVAGGAGGALISGAMHGPRLDLPPEALLQFHLTAPLTVQPVSYNEAERLAATVPQQPILRARPVYAAAPYPYYARPYYYGRPYYGYPAPYYYGRY